MARKFFTALGTTRYEKCEYIWKNKIFEPTPFVQIPIIETLIDENKRPDKTYVLVTNSSYQTSWNLFREEIEKYEEKKNIRLPLMEPIIIREDHEEESIWSNFETIVNYMEEKDKIIFDLTYGIRYFQILVALTLHFASVTRRGVEIEGVFYGYLNPEANQNSIRKGKICDLTSFAMMQKWITLTNLFVESGRAKPLVDWLFQTHPNELHDFLNNLKNFSLSLNLSQLSHIHYLTKKLVKFLESIGTNNENTHNSLRPLYSLKDYLISEIQSMVSSDPVEQGIEATKWCLRHDLFQQAFTIINETAVTSISCIISKKIPDIYTPFDKECRSHASDILNNSVYSLKMLNMRARDYRTKKNLSNDFKDMILEFLVKFYPEFLILFDCIRELRNQINHAGTLENQRHFEFSQKHIELLNSFIESLSDFWKDQKTNRIKSEPPERAVIFICPNILSESVQNNLAREWNLLLKALNDTSIDVFEFLNQETCIADIVVLPNIKDYFFYQLVEWCTDHCRIPMQISSGTLVPFKEDEEKWKDGLIYDVKKTISP